MNEAIRLFREILHRIGQESPKTLVKIQKIVGVVMSCILIFFAVDVIIGLEWGANVVIASLTYNSILIGIKVFLTGIFASTFTAVKSSDKLNEKLHIKNLLPKKR